MSEDKSEIGEFKSEIEVDKSFFSRVLCKPQEVIFYTITKILTDVYPNKKIIEVGTRYFQLIAYANNEINECKLTPKESILSQLLAQYSKKDSIFYYPHNVWYKVEWDNQVLEVLVVTVNNYHHYWIVADDNEIAESFFHSVCAWDKNIDREILVFEWNCWDKNKEIFESIQKATFDKLILPEQLKSNIEHEIKRFFDSQEKYANFDIPWKRGILLTGSPGNGKTLAIKALINQTKQTCLYIKSLEKDYYIHQIFQQARDLSPCILVIEDIDSISTEKNRSIFLNELDGFAENQGILTIATTNHPEKLDPAIFERPGRFDCRYNFDLPGKDERLAYINKWSENDKYKKEPELQLSKQDKDFIVEKTDGFSFAYMEKTMTFALIAWFNQLEPRKKTFEQIIKDEIEDENLRRQQANSKDDEKSKDEEKCEESNATGYSLKKWKVLQLFSRFFDNGKNKHGTS